jgi:adenylylsulfate kinase
MTTQRDDHTEKRRGRPPRLSRGQILATALRLLQEDGREGVTIRAVAEELGVAPMSLYSHVRGIEDVLSGLAGLALDEVDCELRARGPWTQRLRAWAHSVRRQLLRYPEVVTLLDHQHWQSPHALRIIDNPVRLLVEAGLPQSSAVELVQALLWTTFGFVLVEQGQGRHRSEDEASGAQLDVALQLLAGGENSGTHVPPSQLVQCDFDRLFDVIVRGVVDDFEAKAHRNHDARQTATSNALPFTAGNPSGVKFRREHEVQMKLPKSDDRNVTWHPSNITKHDRERLNGHHGATLWFTGLSASGKSTLAHEVEDQLYNREVRAYVLDGDNIRHRLNRDLGFSPEDRTENIRRIGEVARLFNEVGSIVLCAFISPYRIDRQLVRELHDDGSFYEVFCRCPLAVCEQRDPKGLYKKARAGEIKDFTGLTAPYEEPESPELIVDTDKQTIKESAESVIRFLEARGIIVRPVVERPRRIGMLE